MSIQPPAEDLSTDVVATAAEEVGATKIEGRTPWQLVRMRLRRDKTTMFILVVVLFGLIMGITAPILSRLGVLDPFSGNRELIDVTGGGLPLGRFGGVSWAHPLGVVPGTGQDVLSRLVLGVTYSLGIAVSATLLAIGLGTFVGVVAGYSRGWLDFWLSRLIDLTLTFPQTLMLIALSPIVVRLLTDRFGVPEGDIANGMYVVGVLGLFGWPIFARVIRSQVLSIREREFIEAARSLGANNRRIYAKELLPNLWAPILIYSTLLMPQFISAEAALSYLGVGIKPPTPTLGNVLRDSIQYAESDFIFFFFPALFIAILVLSLNLLGDGLRDALDPKADR
ncbi:ABC transporter permease [Kribbia dieselivorans]|uniref:ABC transporter permease n=1 Tax=Kribbia dieselivorans TaxID=331526 RepID=UPI0008392C27|nr:ABC transporter permease [Kribbia dieselivorans]